MINEALTSIKGIGPGREKQLHKLGINNVSNLLVYFPRSYEDSNGQKKYVTEVVADFVGRKLEGEFDSGSNFDSFDNTNQGENIPF